MPGAAAPSPRGSAAPGRRGRPLTARAPPAGEAGEGGGGVQRVLDTYGPATDAADTSAGVGGTRARCCGPQVPCDRGVAGQGQRVHRKMCPARCRGCTAQYVGLVTWKAGPVNTRCLVIWCRRCTTVPSAAQCTPMRMRGPLHGGQGRISRPQGTCRFCARRPAHSWAGRRRDRRRHTRARGAHRAARRAAPAAPRAADLAGATHMPTLKTMGRRPHHPAHRPHPRGHILNLHALPPESQGAVRGLGFAAGGQAQHLARPVQLHHLLKEKRNGGASHEGSRCTAGGRRAPLLGPPPTHTHP